jgi:DNA-binding CsgD family transcriptional regulator/tetratricopeptide (TPR) repeat protein
MVGAIERGREAFGRQAWAEAFEQLLGADAPAAEDLQRLAVSAQLVGRREDSERAWERAHLAHLEEGNPEAAARCAFWLGLDLMLRGEEARAGGWFGRAQRVSEQVDPSCAARGLLLLPVGLEALFSGDLDGAAAVAEEMVVVAQRCGDKDLMALGVMAGGQVAVVRGDARRGMRLLDEVMVSVTAGEVSPIVAGIVYCAVIETCRDAYDVRRAVAWTEAFHTWCVGQSDLVPYRGQCLVHRSEVLQAHGVWSDAAAEATRACELLSEPPHPAVGMALYQQAELHRLRGEADDAERAYRAADEHGCSPMPGLALLRLAEGNVPAAASSIERALEESVQAPQRPSVLAAAVEVLLAAGDLAGARNAAHELVGVAEGRDVVALTGMSSYALGTVLLAEGDAAGAAGELRRALAAWRELDIAYEVARVRVALAVAYREIGDRDSEGLELDAARSAFERLGARPDLERATALSRGPRTGRASDLSRREREVLHQVAAGRTNREIAADLAISEHTVARHVQNIFAKLGVTSRTAAAAHAFRHGLV